MLVHKLFNIAHTWNFNPATSLQLKLVGPPCLPSHLNQKISSSQPVVRGPQVLSDNSSSTLKDFFWELVMIIYGNLTYPENKNSSN